MQKHASMITAYLYYYFNLVNLYFFCCWILNFIISID